jgi:hypothetical protein
VAHQIHRASLSVEPFHLPDQPGHVLLLGGTKPLRPRAAEAGKLERDDVGAMQVGSQWPPDHRGFRDTMHKHDRHQRATYQAGVG